MNWEKLDSLKARLGYQGALVAVAGLVTSGALALASRVTGPEIEAAAARDLQQSLSQVLTSPHDNDLIQDSVKLAGPDGKEITLYRAREKGVVQAVVFQVTGPGYAGPIQCVMGVGRDGRLQGVRVIRHTETPGLGDKIEPAKADWIHAFVGKYLGDPAPDKWAVKKDGGVFDQFAGATITPRGVVKAVKGGLEFFAREKASLLDEGVDKSESGEKGNGKRET
ncbi:MAG: RnfABCDGE type electron transport complex subunit G [Pseudomonadota bacterium]